MALDWIKFVPERKRNLRRATWIPLYLRERQTNAKKPTEIGYKEDVNFTSTVACQNERIVECKTLGWSDVNSVGEFKPYASENGWYKTVFEFQKHDNDTIGEFLVLDLRRPVIGGSDKLLSPDLVTALGLIKEGDQWLRPEEDFVQVARQIVDDSNEVCSIEIKAEFLKDYLCARNMSLLVTSFRERVENVSDLNESPYHELKNEELEEEEIRYASAIRSLDSVFGGKWQVFRSWRTDVDQQEDAPIMGPEHDGNTDYETTSHTREGLSGFRVDGRLWRNEWIEPTTKSFRVRGDQEDDLPRFITEPDGTRADSRELNTEEVGQWLWFNAGVVKKLLDKRGFKIIWYSEETAAIVSTTGHSIHFGLNGADLVVVYAYDIAQLAGWEQREWSSFNVIPEGNLGSELYASQVKAEPAETKPPESRLFELLGAIEQLFREEFQTELFSRPLDEDLYWKRISRFNSMNEVGLLSLAKDLIRVFSDRINIKALRDIVDHKDKQTLKSNKLLQCLVATKTGDTHARKIFGPIAGTYDLRVGDAHPTSSTINSAKELAGVDVDSSYLRQGQQLIESFARSIWLIGNVLHRPNSEDDRPPKK